MNIINNTHTPWGTPNSLYNLFILHYIYLFEVIISI